MSLYKQLKDQAAAVRAMADTFTKAAAAAKELGQLKAAAARPASAASPSPAEKVRLGQMAKSASALLYNAGILQTSQQADVVSGLLMTHEGALQKVAQLAKLCERLPRTATVVVDTSGAGVPKTADDQWAAAVRSVNASLPPG